jgi:hypothetical protein
VTRRMTFGRFGKLVGTTGLGAYLAAVSTGCSSSSQAGAGARGDASAPTEASVVNDASFADTSAMVDVTEDVPVTVICPPSPPVDLNAVPGLIDQCTQIVYVAAGNSGDRLAASFNDAAHWQNVFTDSSVGPNYGINNIAFGFGFGFAVGSADSVVTTNGILWEPDASVPTSGFSQALAFVNNMFVFIGNSRGSGYSFNGLSWEFFQNNDPYSTGASADFYGLQIAYGNGIYVAVGPANEIVDGGNGPAVATYRTSTDGENWSSDTLLGNDILGYLTSVAFGNGTFVVVGTGNGATQSPNAEGLIAWSTDAKNWTIVTNDNPGPLGPMHFSEVARSDTLFVAASNQYSGAGQWWSEDGVHWTASPMAPSVGHLQALESHFIGGPVQGQANGVVTVSDDGKTWTPQVAFSDTSISISGIGIGRVLKSPVNASE